MKVALLSDIHANINALEAVYADLEKENVEHIFVAGDLIGYYYWPKEVIARLRSDNRVKCIRGNHEEILKEVLISEDAATRYRRKYGSGYDACVESLNSEELAWLLALPENITTEIDGVTFHITHGSLSGIDDYLYPDAAPTKMLENYSASMVTVCGHTHYQFVRARGDRILINPGSVGQPRDIGGLASYIIFDTRNLVIRSKRLFFDYSELTQVAKSKDPQLSYLWSIMKR